VPVAALVMDVRVVSSSSLKDKRMVVDRLLDRSRRRFGVAAAELGGHGLWQRAELGFAAVASSTTRVEETLDAVERFVWSHPDLDVLSCDRFWLETDH